MKFNDSFVNKNLTKFEKPNDKDYMLLFIGFKELGGILILFVKEVPMELNEKNQLDGENMLYKLNYEKKVVRMH